MLTFLHVLQHLLQVDEIDRLKAARRAELFEEGADDGEVGVRVAGRFVFGRHLRRPPLTIRAGCTQGIEDARKSTETRWSLNGCRRARFSLHCGRRMLHVREFRWFVHNIESMRGSRATDAKSCACNKPSANDAGCDGGR